MNASNESQSVSTASKKPELARAKIRPMRWPFPIMWIVPLAAAGLAGYYLYQHRQEQGTQITVQFEDAGGLTPNQTIVQLHGVRVGIVSGVELSDDHRHAAAHIRLEERENFLAKKETIFWIVRPELSLESVSGLNALITGPYIECKPGEGASATEFQGLSGPPLINRPGMKIVLHADQLGALTVDSPVKFRGIQVGIVQDIRLSNVADAANVTVYIWQDYTTLVHTGSVFWTVKSADLQGNLFTGVKLKIDSLRSLLGGTVAFATPEKNMGEVVGPNAEFNLNDGAKDEWLKWKPKIPLAPPAASAAPKPDTAGTGGVSLPAPQQKH